MVQATLNGLAYALDVLDGKFDWVVTASGYTYPLASNRRIREELARHPADTEFLEIRPQPNDPMPRAWHQFVECDGKMRRITRLLPPRKIKMYMGSQWMVVTRDFAAYATGRSRRGNVGFAAQYAPSPVHMVADENFFTTVPKIRRCATSTTTRTSCTSSSTSGSPIRSRARPRTSRLQPDPRTAVGVPRPTLDYMPVLELGGASSRGSSTRRTTPRSWTRSTRIGARRIGGYSEKPRQYFENIRFVREAQNGVELCVSMSNQAERSIYEVTLKPCDRRDAQQRFNIGPCSTDGHIELRSGREALVKPGDHSPSPFCPVAHVEGRRMTCLDLNGESIAPGTRIIGFPCNGRWNQLLALGTGARGQPDRAGLLNVPYRAIPPDICA